MFVLFYSNALSYLTPMIFLPGSLFSFFIDVSSTYKKAEQGAALNSHSPDA